MSFLKKNKNDFNTASKKPFYKKRPWKVFFVLFGILAIFIVSFLAYVYANGIKIFDGNSSLIKAFLGNNSLGEERINIVFMGRGGDNHPGGLLTDSLMVISIEPKEKKIALLSIPRDLLVPISGDGEDKINSAFATGYNDYMKEKCNSKNKSSCRDGALSAGANLTRQTVSNVLDIPINYYTMVDFEGFIKAIDKIDGVDVNVEKDLYDPYFPDQYMKGYDPFSITKGEHHMDGATALKYARSRQTSSDFDRAKRQQLVVSAAKDKVLQIGFLSNPKSILDLVDILSYHMRTNLSPSDIRSIADLVGSMDRNSIVNKILSDEADGPLVSDSSSGTYYLKPKTGNFNQIKSIAQNIFSTEVIESPEIEVLNGSKVTGRAGKLAEILQGYGYDITNIANSSEPYIKTVIYDYSNGKMSETLADLKNGLKADVIKKTDSSKKVDISIVIGDNYNGFSK